MWVWCFALHTTCVSVLGCVGVHVGVGVPMGVGVYGLRYIPTRHLPASHTSCRHTPGTPVFTPPLNIRPPTTPPCALPQGYLLTLYGCDVGLLGLGYLALVAVVFLAPRGRCRFQEVEERGTPVGSSTTLLAAKLHLWSVGQGEDMHVVWHIVLHVVLHIVLHVLLSIVLSIVFAIVLHSVLHVVLLYATSILIRPTRPTPRLHAAGQTGQQSSLGVVHYRTAGGLLPG